MSEFEHAVLDKIEQSPVGSVPHTPAYQDALAHLRASHQVYLSADHKGGFVTARSLAALPVFHARNFDALLAGAIPVGELEPDAAIFDRYVASLPPPLRPLAETCRAMVVARKVLHRAHKHGSIVHDPAHTLFLVPGGGPNPGLPGNYLYGSVLERVDAAAAGGWAIHLHDHDDGAARCDLPNEAAAFAKLQEVLASAPFQLDELEALGFRRV